VTLRQAAEMSGLSYPRIYALVSTGQIPSQRDERGVYTIAHHDAARIKRRRVTNPEQRAVTLRPDLERYVAWKRASGDRPVAAWLTELADAAAGALTAAAAAAQMPAPGSQIEVDPPAMSDVLDRLIELVRDLEPQRHDTRHPGVKPRGRTDTEHSARRRTPHGRRERRRRSAISPRTRRRGQRRTGLCARGPVRENARYRAGA
jgi:hypothetical protein